MKLVTIDSSSLKLYTTDPEMLQKAHRPCVLIVKLIYKGHRYDFAVPIRSNISPSSPKDEYFPLPTRSTTKDHYRHGIHYIKMFPVKKSILLKYRTDGNVSAALMKATIDNNEKRIVSECQQYLKRYENGYRSPYATDIDQLLEKMQLLH